MKCYRCSTWPCECVDRCTLINGDCREIVPELGYAFDMVLADPPYGETNLEWDRWPKGWVEAIDESCRPHASLWCFGSMRMLLDNLREFEAWRYVQEVVWEKHNGSGFNVDRFRRVHELIFHFVPHNSLWAAVYKSPQFTNDATPRVVRKKSRPKHWHGETGATVYQSIDGGPRMMRSVQHVRSMHGKALHPTEKPQGILQPVLEYSLPPEGLLLIPFSGSGAELLAAKRAGRRAVGIELQECYCEVAANRLAQGVLSFDEPSI